MIRLLNKLSIRNFEMKDGTFNKLNKFCQKKMESDVCQNFYNHISSSEDDMHICPYGFVCIKKYNSIYNCLLIKEFYNHSKMKQKKDLEQKVFLEQEINNLIMIDEENEKIQKDSERLFKSMSDFLHDITKVNNMINTKTKNISKTNLTKVDASKLESIYHLSDFITKRIELYKFTSNPAIINTGRKRECNAFQLWDIYRYIFNDIGKESSILIEMKIFDMEFNEVDNEKTFFKANNSITVLPYLLIDNAVKYSESNSIIKVHFYQEHGILKKITMSSRPSYIITDDYKNFFERGYRAENNTSQSSGSGLGLNIAKQICDFNDIDISIDIDVDDDGKQIFIVILNFETEEI